MSRSNVSKLYGQLTKLEKLKMKIERRIDNLKREYVRVLQTINQITALAKEEKPSALSTGGTKEDVGSEPILS